MARFSFGFLAVCALVMALPATLPAADGRGTLNVVFENDRAANTDRHFTHGSYASYVTRRGGAPDWAVALGEAVPGRLMDKGVDRIGFVLGQDMFTPDDIGRFDLIEGDRPYAGWLYTGMKLIAEERENLQRLELDVGVVGPASRADDTQAIVHEVLGVQRPNGWDNQLDNEPGVVLIYERKWRRLDTLPLTDIEIALIPHATAALGNVYTFAAGGASLAIGQELEASWGPARIFPGLRGSDFFEAGERLHWQLFMGGQVRAVARNIFLDGNTFADSHSVDKEPVVGDFQFGAQLAYDRYRLAFTQVVRTREFENQIENDLFGAITLSVQF